MTTSTTSTRSITLQNTLLSYQLIRAARRSVSVRVEADGVIVRAPRWLAIHEVEAIMHGRASWIVRTMDWWRRHARVLVSPDWRSGAEVLYRGEMLPLLVSQENRSDVRIGLPGIQVAALSSDSNALEQMVRQWWWREAEKILIPRAMTIAARMERVPATLRLSRARNQWGSCNACGEISLNWRLILLPPE